MKQNWPVSKKKMLKQGDKYIPSTCISEIFYNMNCYYLMKLHLPFPSPTVAHLMVRH